MSADSALAPHRLLYGATAMLLIGAAIVGLDWSWLPRYAPMLWQGLWTTLWLLAASTTLGFLLAIPIGLVQVVGPRPLAIAARVFCSVIRGTPLLLQLWLLYYGLGSLFPSIPWLRDSFLWPVVREAWPYALAALTLSYAGYEGEVLRGAFAGVPRGELEAGRAFGLSPAQLLRRIWLPRALLRALPTLVGESILQLKATPLAATVTVVDLYAVLSRVRQDTLQVYAPLLFLAAAYLVLSALLTIGLRAVEARFPQEA